MRQRTNQGGSVVAFVIVGVVLATVVSGGVYLVNQRNKDTSTQQPTTNQPADDSQQQEGNPTPQTQTPVPNNTQPNPTPSNQNPPTTGVTQNSQLPSTGPADTLLAVLALGSLTATASAYVRSQAHKRRLAAAL